MATDWWEVVLFVKINLFLLLRHVLEVYIGSSLANAGTAQLHLLLLVNYKLSISAEYTFKSGDYWSNLDDLLNESSDLSLNFGVIWIINYLPVILFFV